MKKLFEGICRALVWTTPLIAVGFSTQGRALNDTGTTQCYTTVQTAVACNASSFSDASGHPRQDARIGRDASPSLVKIGGGAGGFDFTKLSNAGNTLPASAVRGNGATDWGCTRDNTTGLTWEVKTTTAGLQSNAHTYNWYNPNSASNGGLAGNVGNNSSCSGLATCDTNAYIAAINASNLCGHNDWRLPSYKEAMSIYNGQAVGSTNDPAFDPVFLAGGPRTMWTANTEVNSPANAWLVTSDPTPGPMANQSKNNLRGIRLVRGTYAFQ